jgi:iron complex outermembrane receptor protein
VQDEIALFAHRLALTVGTHLQYDSDSGAGVQPTARLMWKMRSHQRVWAATSRALRTPARSERGIRLDWPPIPTESGLPMVVTQLGNPAAHTETFVDAKAGYRWEIGTAASIDVTGFVGYYEYLATRQLEAPILQLEPSPHLLLISRFDNQLQATTRGLEVAAHWSPSPTWRLDGSYTGFKVTPRLATGSTDPTAATTDGNTPRTQWQLRSAWAPVPRATLNLAIFRVGRLEQLRVGAYTRADVTAEWRITRRLSAMAIGQNLFDAAHPEFATAESFLLSTQVPRSVSLRLRWTSR